MYRLCRLAAASLFFAVPLCAQSSAPPVQIHGFADWGTGHSNGGTYEFGSKGRTMSAGTFAVLLTANASPRTSIISQIGFDGIGHGVTEPKLDIIFAQYQLSDALKFNIGRVKQPFGEYSEIFDVGTAHNMLSLPHGEYDVSGTMGEVYNGVGFTGGKFTDNSWGFRYDGYFGDVGVSTRRPWEGTEESTRLIHGVIGGRGIIETPLSGVSVGISAYSGHLADSLDVSSGEQHSAYGAQFDWQSNRFSVRSEVTRQQEPGVRETAAYIETTARFAKFWQLAGRLDRSRATGSDVVGTLPTLSRHTDVAAGLNYWIAPGFVLRAELHDVVGNRFADAISSSNLGKHTRVLEFGSQFSF